MSQYGADILCWLGRDCTVVEPRYEGREHTPAEPVVQLLQNNCNLIL